MLSSQKNLLRVAAGAFAITGALLLGTFWLLGDGGDTELRRAAPQFARSIERQLNQTVATLDMIRATVDTERGANALSPAQQERTLRSALRAALAIQPATIAVHVFGTNGQVSATEPATRRGTVHPLAAEAASSIVKAAKTAATQNASTADAVAWRFDSTTAEPVLIAQLALRDGGERAARLAIEISFLKLVRQAGDSVAANGRFVVSTARGDAVAVADHTDQSWQVLSNRIERIGTALGRPSENDQLIARLAAAGKWQNIEFEPLQMIELSVAALPRGAESSETWRWLAISLAALAANLIVLCVVARRLMIAPAQQMFDAIRLVRKGVSSDEAVHGKALPAEWHEEFEAMAQAHYRLRKKYSALKRKLIERDEAIAVNNDAISKVRSVLHAKTVAWATTKAEDDVTGLPNRRQFKRIVHDEWRRSARSKQPLTLALIHVDGYNRHVELNGREAGDELLLSIASVLRASFRRAGDLVARSSIDQFAVLIPGLEPCDVLPHIQEMRQRIALMNTPSGSADAPPKPTSTVAVGIAGFLADPRNTWRTLAQLADSALQRAVQDGGNCVRLVEGTAADAKQDGEFEDLVEVPNTGGLMVNPKFVAGIPRIDHGDAE